MFFVGQRILGVSAISDAVCLVASIVICFGFAAIV